jgi:hypothetical protein
VLSSNSLYNIVTFYYNGDFKITTKQQEEKDIPTDSTVRAPNRIDTSLSLRIDPFYIVLPGSIYGLSGRLLDSTGTPLNSKKITFSVGPDIGSLPPINQTRTDSLGTFKVNGLRAPMTEGWYNIQAHFEGGGRYNPSDSDVIGLWVNSQANKSS